MWNKLGQKALRFAAKKTGNTIIKKTFDGYDRLLHEAYGIKSLNDNEDSIITARQYCYNNPMCKPVIMWEDKDAGQVMNSKDYLYNEKKQELIQEYVGYRRSRIK